MKVVVQLAPRAQRMLDQLDQYWSREDYAGDNPLFAELDEAVERLRNSPWLGVVFRRGTGSREVRRLLLRSGWHLYYRYDATQSLLEIAAVWYAGRGEGPPL